MRKDTPPESLQLLYTQRWKEDISKKKISRANVAAMFYVMMNQLTKAVTGIDYESGPHAYKRKRAKDADLTTPVKAPKTTLTATPSTSQPKSKAPSSTKIIQKKQMDKQQDSDTLSSSMDLTKSDSLSEVNLGSAK